MNIACKTCNARNSPLCSVFKDDEISTLFAIAHSREIEVGGYLLHEEDSANKVYNISSGTLALERLASNGARQIMAFLYGGNFIGLASGGAYSVSGRALTALSACQWHGPELEKLYKKFPKLEERIRMIASRVVEATMDQLFVLGRKTTVEKIAWFLLFIEAKQSLVEDISDTFVMPMTRLDIADYLGLAVETISRGFTELRKQGLIDLPQNWTVKIMDREALIKLGGYQ